MMYNVLYHDNSSLLHNIKCEGKEWEEKYRKEYKKEGPCDCELLHPTFIMTQ